MINNEIACRLRSEANAMRRALRNRNTQKIKERTKQIKEDPAFLNALIKTFALWEIEANNNKASDEYSLMRALAQTFRFLHSAECKGAFRQDDVRIQNAEAPFTPVDGWMLSAGEKQINALPFEHWEYVFLKDNTPMAAFDDNSIMLQFWDFIQQNNIDFKVESKLIQCTKKEMQKTKEKYFFYRSYGEKDCRIFYRGQGNFCRPVDCMPYFATADRAARICALLNKIQDESDADFSRLLKKHHEH